MNVVLLSCCDPTALYCLSHLRARRRVDLIHIVWLASEAQPRPPLLTRLARLDAGRVRRRIMAVHRDYHGEWMQRRLGEELFAGHDAAVPADALQIGPNDVNAEKGISLLSGLAPDVLLVNGAPVLKKAFLAVPRLGAINTHFGIAPAYRGSYALFWAMYDRRWDLVGGTLHEINEGLDAGPVLTRFYPELSPDVDEATVMARCARAAAEELTDVLDALEQGRPVSGRPQEPGGRNYRSHERELWRDAFYLARRRLGFGRPPRRSERRERHW